MASTYTTQQGDTWDSISFKIFGDEKYMKYLCEANWPLLDTMTFSSGTVLNVPDIPEEADEDAPFWRAGDAEDLEEFEEESDDDVEEDDEYE